MEDTWKTHSGHPEHRTLGHLQHPQHWTPAHLHTRTPAHLATPAPGLQEDQAFFPSYILRLSLMAVHLVCVPPRSVNERTLGNHLECGSVMSRSLNMTLVDIGDSTFSANLGHRTVHNESPPSQHPCAQWWPRDVREGRPHRQVRTERVVRTCAGVGTTIPLTVQRQSWTPDAQALR